MRMFPPKLRNSVESKPNTGGPINAKETHLKIYTHIYLHPPNRLLSRVCGRKIKVATAKRREEGYVIETENQDREENGGEAKEQGED